MISAPDQPISPGDARLEPCHRAVVEDQRLVCRWRPDGSLTFVSDAYARYLGQPAEQLVGRAFLSLVADTDRDRVREHLASLGPANPIGMIEHRATGRAAEVRWHRRVTQVLFDVLGQVREIESVARDITDQQQTAAEVERLEAAIRALFQSASEGIVGVNRSGEVVLVNPRAGGMFGYRPQELLGQPAELLIPDRLKHAHAQRFREFFDRPRTRRMGVDTSLMGRRKDGTEFPIEISMTSIPGPDGALVVAFITDISERVLQERHARHVEKLTALGTLAAGIAHELNNPIGIILSRLELMLMDSTDRHASDESIGDLRVLQRQAQRLSQIAQGLLSFGRPQQHEPQPVDLAEVIQEILLLAGKQLSRDRVVLRTALEPRLPRVSGDATALQQVVMNLLLNARDAMPDGGTLRIEASSVRDRPGVVRLVVADTGCGMPADVLARIGQPYFTTKSHGTGLGLSVSYTIVREHGGHIDVHSEPGCGSTFTVTLPGMAGDGTG